MAAPHQITRLPGQSSMCIIKVLRSKCNESCDWCVYVTVVTFADAMTYIQCIQ